MAIEIKNKFYIMISDGDKDIVENPENLLKLGISFEGGLDIPLFELVFLADSKDTIKKINERSQLYCQIGKTSQKPYIITLYPRNLSFQKSGQYFKVIVGGTILVPQKYYNNSIIYSKKGTSKEIIKDLLNKINIKTNDFSTNTNDRQIWLNYNKSTYKFLQDVYKHSYINDTNCLLLGFNFYGDFLIKDLQTQIKSEEKINFVYGVQKTSKDKTYNLDYSTFNDFGIFNNFSCYTKNVLNYNIINDTSTLEKSPKLDTKLANAPFPNIIDITLNKNINSYIFNENTHENYNKAPLVNSSIISFFSEFQIEVETYGEFIDVELFDKIYFNDYITSKGSNQLLNGYYIISKIDILFFKGTFTMKYILSRESMNDLKETGYII